MFVRRESSIPFANRLPTLRFNGRDPGCPTVNHDVSKQVSTEVVGGGQVPTLPPPPLKSSLKPSSFLHPILVTSLHRANKRRTVGSLAEACNHHGKNIVYDPTVTPRNSTLCILINVKLIGSINSIEEIARTSIDVLTFPVPFRDAKSVEIFGRFKACLIVIATAVGKISGIKTPQGKMMLAKHAGLQTIINTLKSAKKIAKTLHKNCKSFAKYNESDYTTWALLVRGTIEPHLHSNQKTDYHLYSDMTLPLGPEDFKSYEEVTDFNDLCLNLRWTKESFLIQPNMNFVDFPEKCQLEFLQEVAEFSESLMQESNIFMEACLERWEADFSSSPIRSGYNSIREEIDELKLEDRADATLYFELKNTMEMLNVRKLDLVKASSALVVEVKGLRKLIKRVIKYVQQTYNGRQNTDRFGLCHYCVPYMDLDDLTKLLCADEKWEIVTSLPISPSLTDLINACKPKKDLDDMLLEDDLPGFVDVSLSDDEGHGGDMPKS